MYAFFGLVYLVILFWIIIINIVNKLNELDWFFITILFCPFIVFLLGVNIIEDSAISEKTRYIIIAISQGTLIFFLIAHHWIFYPRKLLKKAFKKIEEAYTIRDTQHHLNFILEKVLNNQLNSRYAHNLLAQFQSKIAINLFCQEWERDRNSKLTEILLKSGYIATQPPELEVLTALKVNKIQTCIDQNPQLIKTVLEYFEDQDTEIAQRARQIAISLASQEVIDYLFYLCVEEDNQAAFQSIQKANYQSKDIQYRTLFHFLRDEWDTYNSLDFDQVILQKIYQSVGTELRKIIAEKARQHGWTEWLKVAQKSREKMTPEEWENTIAILKNNKDYAQMWQLVGQAPIWVCQKLLIELSNSSYQVSVEGQIIFQKLLVSANFCQSIKLDNIEIKNKYNLLCTAEGKYQQISPDWQYLITSSSNSTKLWRISDRKLLLSAQGDHREISPNWQYIITQNRSIEVWEIGSGERLLSSEGSYKISSDWQYIITNNKNSTKLWRISDGKLLLSAQGDHRKISPDWQFLLIYQNKETKIWRVVDGKLLLSVHSEYPKISPNWQFLITSVGFFKDACIKVHRMVDGKLILSAQGNYLETSPDQQLVITSVGFFKDEYIKVYECIKVYKIVNGKLLLSAQGNYQGISPDSQYLITFDNHCSKVYRIADGKLLLSAEGQYQHISPDCQYLITSGNKDKSTKPDLKNLKVWRISDGKLLLSSEGSYQLSPDWQYLITSSSNYTKLWKISDGKLLLSSGGKYQHISPDWQFLLLLNYEYSIPHIIKNIKVLRISDGKLLLSAEENYKEISPNSQYLITFDSHYSRVYSIEDGKLLLSAEGQYKHISPDWQYLITSGDKDKSTKTDLKNPKLWRISDGKLLLSSEGSYQLSPDWQYLITSSSNYTKLSRISDGQLLLSAEGQYEHISPDWQFLLTYQNRETKIWRVADGKLLLSAQGYYGEISPDWQFLCTYYNNYRNNLTKIWRVADGKLLLSIEDKYKEISPDWQFLLTDYNGEIKLWEIYILSTIKFYLVKFTDQLTIEDINFLKDFKNQTSDYVYPKIADEQKPWLDFMIALAEYKLMFDVDITEDTLRHELGEFDIEIEG